MLTTRTKQGRETLWEWNNNEPHTGHTYRKPKRVRERALQPPLFVQLSLGNSTQAENSLKLTQTGVSLFLTTAVAAELDTVLALIDFINYARMCVSVRFFSTLFAQHL